MFVRDIAEILQSQGIGTLGTDLFLVQIPFQPDSLIALIPTGGYATDLPISDVRLTAQVFARDTSEENCYNKIWRVFNALIGDENRCLIAPSGRKMVIQALQPPESLGRDENNRAIYVFNIAAWTRRD